MTLKHNRKRNIGIVYEMLIRHLSDGILRKDQVQAVKALGLLKKHFSAGSCLSEELSLFETVDRAKGASRRVCERVLAEVMDRASELDQVRLDRAKTELIHEVNRKFGRDFFSRFRLPSYRTLAAVQTAIFRKRRDRVDPVEMAMLHEELIAHLSEFKGQDHDIDPDHDHVAYGIAKKRFAEKYDGNFSERQRMLLESLISGLFAKDLKEFRKRALADQESLFIEIRRGSSDPDVVSDPILAERMKRVSRELRDLDVSSGDPRSIAEELMLFHSLVEELRQDV